MSKKEKRKRGRPVGGQYPEAIRLGWREYKRLQRQAEKESKRIVDMASGKKRRRNKS